MERGPSFDAHPMKRVSAHGEQLVVGKIYIWRGSSWHPRTTSETDLGRAVQQNMSGEASMLDLYTIFGFEPSPCG